MMTMTATEASRGFSALLDRVEHDHETILIQRDDRTVARIQPEPEHTGAALMDFFADSRNRNGSVFDDQSLSDHRALMSLLIVQEDSWGEG
jgi:antitoxin (DNA-binding transcriptional repressor) of toxin-antitoxin stability system